MDPLEFDLVCIFHTKLCFKESNQNWVGQDVGVDLCDFAPHLAMLYGRNC